MYYKDLRDWLKIVDEIGELVRIDGADWDLEIGALNEISRKHAEREEAPALLFDKVKGYPPGYRVLSTILWSNRRVALTAGFEADPSNLRFIRQLHQRIHDVPPIPPRFVDSGPVLENVHTGNDINLLEFPAPKWHEEDGGRFIATGDAIITRDPDEGWVNIGTYRVMIHDGQHAGLYTSSTGKHGGLHIRKHWAQGKPCPVVVSAGHDPLLFMVGSGAARQGFSEFDLAGGLKGEPIEVIRGPHTGLPIPAHSEIVIEGEMWPDELRDEGPFGEYTGYYGSGKSPQPVIRVKSIMHRNDPIITGAPPSKPPSDGAFIAARMLSALTWEQMEAAGVPGIQGVWFHLMGATFMLKVVTIKQLYPGHARQALAAVVGSQAGAQDARYVIVADEDIDPTDLGDVMWAVSTRADPERAIEISRRGWTSALDVGVDNDLNLNSRCLIDACRPYERISTFPHVVGTSPELRERVLNKFGTKLFGSDR